MVTHRSQSTYFKRQTSSKIKHNFETFHKEHISNLLGALRQACLTFFHAIFCPLRLVFDLRTMSTKELEELWDLLWNANFTIVEYSCTYPVLYFGQNYP